MIELAEAIALVEETAAALPPPLTPAKWLRLVDAAITAVTEGGRGGMGPLARARVLAAVTPFTVITDCP